MSDDLVSRPWRCDVTGNPVGTDTATLGAKPCQCQGCRAAQALTEVRAEIERLKSGINGIVNCQGPMTRAQVREACAEILDNKTVGLDDQSPFAEAMLGYKARALAAESELSTLRARVREVVEPFASRVPARSFRQPDGTMVARAGIQIEYFRAARQLMEEVK